MRGKVREDRMMIGVIYYRIISDSSEKREDRYEEERIMLDLRFQNRNYHSRKEIKDDTWV